MHVAKNQLVASRANKNETKELRWHPFSALILCIGEAITHVTWYKLMFQPCNGSDRDDLISAARWEVRTGSLDSLTLLAQLDGTVNRKLSPSITEAKEYIFCTPPDSREHSWGAASQPSPPSAEQPWEVALMNSFIGTSGGCKTIQKSNGVEYRWRLIDALLFHDLSIPVTSTPLLSS